MFERFRRALKRTAPFADAATNGSVARPSAVRPALAAKLPLDAPPATSVAALVELRADRLAAKPDVPEQPVPLPALPGATRARVGVVLAARRPSLTALTLPIPHVPKRAILAAGICAGLVGPAVTRQLAARALLSALGPSHSPAPATPAPVWESTTVEIIRIASTGQRPGQAAAIVGKLLDQLRR